MPSDDSVNDFIETAAITLAVLLDPAWKPAIRANLEVTLKLARLVEEFPLPDDFEPASVYKA